MANFSDTSIFYAALYWISALPGADVHMAAACSKRGLPVEQYRAPRGKDESRDLIEPLTKEQFTTLLETLLEELKKPAALQYTSDGSGTHYIDVRRSMAKSFPPQPPRLAAEIALAAAGIDDENAGSVSTAYIHDTGQVFVHARKDDRFEIQELFYPGRPEMPFTTHVDFKTADMAADGKFVFEQFYRVERLEKDEKYTWSYNAIDGKRHNMETSNWDDNVVTVSGTDAAALAALTREDIITGKVANSSDDEKRFTGNYVDTANKERVDATDIPGIYRELRGPFNYMAVKQPMQLYSGSSFVMAQPGDRLWAEKETSTPRIIRPDKHHLMKPYRKPEGGTVKFKPKPPSA